MIKKVGKSSLHSDGKKLWCFLGGVDQCYFLGASAGLLSYYFYMQSKDGTVKKEFKEYQMAGVKIFLDSGAFSANSKGVTIDVYEYIEFIKKWEKYIDVYVNLDVIGDGQKSWDNLRIMEDAGLTPMPVFHGLDNIKWLKRMLDEKYAYIGVGGIAGSDSGKVVGSKKMSIISRLWNDYLTDSDGLPLVKVHGFGITDVMLLVKFPWWSVDSTSWMNASRHGTILVPQLKGGKQNYTVKPLGITISADSPRRNKFGEHFDTMSLREREYIIGYLKDMNVTVEDCRTDYIARDKVCIMFYQRVVENLPDWPWPMQKSLVASFV